MKPAVLLATMLLMAACGTGNPPAAAVTSASPTSSPVATPSPSPASTPVGCSTSNRCFALVMIEPNGAFVVRDITDINHPKTVAAYQHDWPKFVSGTTLSYVENGTRLFRTPVSGDPKALVASTGEQFATYAWSPDGNTVAYLAPNGSGVALHLVSGGHDVAIAGGIPAVPAVGCQNQPCPGADTWDFKLSYSPDGAYISLVLNLPGVTSFRLWSSDGKLALSSDSQSRSMSTWSGNALYFPDGNGIEMLRNGTTSSFLPGLSWIHPAASPAGDRIVYETRDAQGWHHVSVVDIASHKIRELKKARTVPAFLTSRYVWYRGEGSPGIYSSKNYIYDLQTGTEYESIIDQVFDIWPHAA
jgi:hypothetical protein